MSERPPLLAIDAIVAMLAARAGELCATILPNGTNRDGDRWHAATADDRVILVYLDAAEAGHWQELRLAHPRAVGEPLAAGDALDLIARLKTRGDKAKALRWARDWLALDRGSPAIGDYGDFIRALCEPGYLARAGSAVSALGVAAPWIFVQTARGERLALWERSLRFRRTVDEIFADDRVPLSALFPPRTARDKAAGSWSLQSAQFCLIAQCAHAGIVSAEQLGISLPRRRA